jgi:alpha-ketoglutarate-dependent taurine dioxygenase
MTAVPRVDLNTIWVDAHAAWEGLSAESKTRFEGLFVTQDFRDSLAGSGHDHRIVPRPIVRAYRETDEEILWVFCVGVAERRSNPVLSA